MPSCWSPSFLVLSELLLAPATLAGFFMVHRRLA
jgi:hypothetical protein